MNSKITDKYTIKKHILSNPNLKDIAYSVLESSISKKSKKLGRKNLKFFPIETKNSFKGSDTIDLDAEEGRNINNYILNKLYYKNSNKKRKKKNKKLILQRSIELQIKKNKFEYLLNFPVKSEGKNNYKTNKIKRISQINIDDEKEIEKIDDNKYNTINNTRNIKKDFILSMNLFDKSHNKKNKELIHSLSVENFYNEMNKSFSSFNETLENIDENFIDKIKNSKRKKNLKDMIEKYKRFKSLTSLNVSNHKKKPRSLGLDQIEDNNIDKAVNRIKSSEKMYNFRNNYNIIEEDENENSENESIIKNYDSKNEKLKNNQNNNKIDNNNKTISFKNPNQKRKNRIIKTRMSKMENFTKIKNKKDLEKKKITEIKKESTDNNICDFNNVNSNACIKKFKNKYHFLNREKFYNKLTNNTINNDKDINFSLNYKNKIISPKNNQKKCINKINKFKKEKKHIQHDKNENNIKNKLLNNNLIDSINNNINNKIDNNNNNNNNLQNKNSYNKSIYNNYTKDFTKNKPKKVLIKKILKEGHYIIDDNSQDKILEFNHSLFDNSNKNNQKKINNMKHIRNYTVNLEQELIEKERHEEGYKRILFPDDYTKKNLRDKKDYSFNIPSKIINYKIKKNYTTFSPNNKIPEIKTSNNSHDKEKEESQKLKFSKLSRPAIVKKMNNKLIQMYSPSNRDLYENKYQNININNNLDHVIYIQSLNSPYLSPEKLKKYSNIEINKNSDYKNKNHSYHEISSFSGRKPSITSKTIYHDHNIYEKKIPFYKYNINTSKINSYQNLVYIKKNSFSSKLSSNSLKKQSLNSSKKFNLDNIKHYNSKESNNFKTNFENYKTMKNTYNIYNNINEVSNYDSNKSENKVENKIKYYKISNFMPSFDYNRNTVKKYSDYTTPKNILITFLK